MTKSVWVAVFILASAVFANVAEAQAQPFGGLFSESFAGIKAKFKIWNNIYAFAEGGILLTGSVHGTSGSGASVLTGVFAEAGLAIQPTTTSLLGGTPHEVMQILVGINWLPGMPIKKWFGVESMGTGLMASFASVVSLGPVKVGMGWQMGTTLGFKF